MISRQHRFHGRASIRRLYAGGKSIRSSVLALRYTPTSRPGGYRLGVVVSRKVSKSAVTRNRIRRRVYEHVRILSSQLSQPYDLLVTVYDPSVHDMPTDKLAREIDKLFEKAGVTSAKPTPHDIVEPKA